MAQQRLPGLLEAGAGRLRIFSGYSFSISKEIQRLSSGIVSGPRWVKQSVKEYSDLPIILDNGAFPAWMRGEPLSFADQLQSVIEGAALAGPLLESIIAPDIVGGGPASWKRTVESMRYLEGHALLLPVQEGVDIEEAVALAKETGFGLFVGGASMAWKVRATKQIAKRVYTHVGRVSRDGHLWTFSQLADAVDSTTWTRAQNWNKTVNWPQILRRYSEFST